MPYNIESSYRELLKSIDEKPASKEVLDRLESITTNIHKVLVTAGLTQDYDKFLEDQAFGFFFGENGFENDEMFTAFVESSQYEEVCMDTILDYISSRIDYLLSQKETLEELAALFGIKVVPSKRVLLEPMDLKASLDGDGNFENKKQISENKSKLILAMLFENGFVADDVNVVTGVLRKNMMRKESYNCIEIASLGVKIFVNNGYGEATYILTNSESWRDLFGKTKQELIDQFGAVRLIFSKNDVEGWLGSISDIIFASDLVQGRESDITEGIFETSMAEDYFKNVENVKKDLEAYANEAGREVLDLIVGFRGKAVCNNGEIVTFFTYLRRAGISLGIIDTVENERTKVLTKLQLFAGYDVMNKNYFLDTEKLRYDLEKFAESAGCKVEELSTNSMNRITCYNGQEFSYRSYLSLAGVELGLAETQTEARGMISVILVDLLELLGYEVDDRKKDFDMDQNYFESLENIKDDLEKYAESAGCEVYELNATSAEKVKCNNGEFVSLVTYLARYAVVFGFQDTSYEARCNSAYNFKKLLEFAGFESPIDEEMSSEYFANVENVRVDLEKYAESVGCEIYELNATSSEIVKCNNGENVRFVTYLARYAAASGLYRTLTEARGNSVHSFKTLLEYAGFESPISEEMSSEYFANVENVRADLEKYAASVGCEVYELGVTSSVRVKCNNGENVRFATYLDRAGLGLGIYKLSINSRKDLWGNLNALLEYAYDYDMDKINIKRQTKKVSSNREIAKLERDYYSNKEIVRADLDSFAEVMGRPVAEFNLNTRVNLASIECQNGDSISFCGYLDRVSRAFAKVENGDLVPLSMREALYKLFEIYGCEESILVEMGVDYFENIENIKNDLNSFSLETGNPIGDLSISSPKRAMCSNGEIISLKTYLYRASKIYSIDLDCNESVVEYFVVLKHLYDLCGIDYLEYDSMDEGYFSDRNNIQEDLNRFADFHDTTVSYIPKDNRSPVVCNNGEPVTTALFLERAKKYMDLPDSYTGTDVLYHLIRYVGWEVELMEEMNREYFEKQENVRNDLKQFAIQASRKVENLSTGVRDSAMCSNGEIITFHGYIFRISRAFGLSSNHKESTKTLLDALNLALKLGGYEPRKKYPKMDESYFADQSNVVTDLNEYARLVEVDVTDLAVGSKVKAICQNGESVQMYKYITRAGLALGLAEKVTEARNKKKEIFEELLVIYNSDS